ncbi:MAG: caspase family protein [Gammaproteobacteria bacterium]|nr:caspase family protein [Gammaproteobacteria bacterium]
MRTSSLLHLVVSLVVTVIAGTACAPQRQAVRDAPNTTHADKASQLLIVDCLLPGQVRKLGQRLNYISPRRPARVSASECEIRGGEYVSYDRATQATSLLVWLEQAKGGDPVAQTYVGEIYEKGLGVPSDYLTASQWYVRAANQGHTRAQINLGHLYEQGLGVQRDPIAALNWYRKASGFAGSEVELVSAVEVQSRDARIQQLQGNLAQSEGEVASLRNERAALRNDIAASKQRRAQLERNLVAARQAPAQGIANPASDVELRQNSDEAQTLRLALAQKESEERLLRTALAESEARAARTASTLAIAKGELASLSATQQSARASEREALENQLRAREAELAAAEELETQRKSEEQALRRDLAKARERKVELDAELRAKDAQTASLQQQLANATQSSNATAEQTRAYREAVEKLAANERELRNAAGELGRERGRTTVLTRRIAQLEAETGRLQTELAKRDTASSTISKSQEELAAALKAKQTELVDSLAQSQAREAKLAEEVRRKSEQVKAWQKQARTNLDRLSSHRAQSAGKIAALETDIRKLNDAVAAQEKRVQELDRLPERSLADAGPPTISVVSPRISVLRGSSVPKVSLPGGVLEVELIGQVIAGRGLRSFQVNYQPFSPDERGHFQTTVRLGKGTQTPISLVAIDRDNKRTQFDFVVSHGAANNSAPVLVEPRKRITDDMNFGAYHAIVIGNNNYQQMPKLQTAVRDAQQVAKLLEQRYGFNVKLLENATRATMLNALHDMREKLKSTDRLLIYYAGHGELKRDANGKSSGYWLPVDADGSRATNWIANYEITKMLDAMSAKHVMVIADSCYSGTWTPPSVAPTSNTSRNEDVMWYENMLSTRTRVALTSGGLQPVLDSGGGRHSLFAKAFLDALRANEGVLQDYDLYLDIYKRMRELTATANTDQRPQHGGILLGGHEMGVFFFKTRRLSRIAGDRQFAHLSAPPGASPISLTPLLRQ